jgi:hypothetical protein
MSAAAIGLCLMATLWPPYTREHVRSISGYIVVDPQVRLIEAMAK